MKNKKKKSKTTQIQPLKRAFHGASIGNLYSSWMLSQTSANSEIKNDLRTLRNRSRDLMQNDDYAKKFKRLIKSNVIGNHGIRLQNKAKDLNGDLDNKANDLIEEAFLQWSKVGNCDVSARYSFIDIQKEIIAAIASDGEVLVRKVRGYPNKWGFAIQLLEADHLDETYTDYDKNIIMGVEFDQWGKAIAYHILKTHPGDQGIRSVDTKRERIKADEILHLFIPYRISATRGIPWMHTAMTRLKMINGYEEAELTASRIAASKGGFFIQSANGDEYTGDYEEQGALIDEVTPGQYTLLPHGIDFKSYDPQHPTSNFKDFMKVVLRGISAGLDVSYNSLTNDLESVNYSSLRAGVLEEREVWTGLQTWICEHLLDDIFSNWLDMALLKGAINLPYSKKDKFNAPSWLPRSFAWVDPLKDMQANILAIQNGLKTYSKVASEMGMDLEELYAQIDKENELKKIYNINLATSTIKPSIQETNNEE
ncbi:phage portal protein, lambda family, putative [Campylobacter iguaniorum]|uniref:phage portal protein n=1 Tax=Campylobacter iguaniorum TaxID=1244531 RepID=UPI00073A2EF1|nr:phage portal protein [Campylobacter iguaniorum]ALV25034.1 phage portal protein, lambda family, putative [Campylobacter iguaniorum]